MAGGNINPHGVYFGVLGGAVEIATRIREASRLAQETASVSEPVAGIRKGTGQRTDRWAVAGLSAVTFRSGFGEG